MSGRFTRNHDQPCNIIRDTRQSSRPGFYNMYTGQHRNCDPSLTPYGSVPTGRRDDTNNPSFIDIESKLLRQNSNPEFDCGREKMWHLNVNQRDPDYRKPASKLLVPEHSLMTHPKAYYTEAQIDRFYDLPIDNERWVFWDYALNTKTAAKDAHVIKYPRLLSHNPALPPAQRSRAYN